MSIIKLRIPGAILLVTFAIAITACDSTNKSAPQEKPAMPEEKAGQMQDKPGIHEERLLTLDATVTAINHSTREVTLQNAAGEKVSFVADEDVKNLAQVESGDKVMIEYLEAVSVQVLDPDQAESGAEALSATARAELGEKPAGAAVEELTLVVVIEAIDMENEKVTLKGPQGNSKTVKVRNPDNLQKVSVGDKVMITYTEAIAVNVTEQ